MTPITREYLDSFARATEGWRLDPIDRAKVRYVITGLRRVLDLCDRNESKQCPDDEPHLREALVTTQQVRAALAGTQTDDGAEGVPSPMRDEPAPSSPERIRVAFDALWVTEHFPVDENDMRLPSRDHPDFVRMDMVTYPSVEAVVAAIDAYDREHPSPEVERQREAVGELGVWKAEALRRRDEQHRLEARVAHIEASGPDHDLRACSTFVREFADLLAETGRQRDEARTEVADLRERIATDIEAHDDLPFDSREREFFCEGLATAARIARGAS